jgi:hypothetical protein
VISLKSVYILGHSYDYEFVGEKFDEIKMMCAFSTREKAHKEIDKLKTLPGFNDHPLECFLISKLPIDEIIGLEEGLIKWEDVY